MVNKDIYAEKHEGKGMQACLQSPTKHKAKPKQACLISVACRLAKCRSDCKEQEARSGSKSSLLEFASLSSHEVPTERSEGKARSPTETSLLAISSLSSHEVPKRSEGKSLCLSKSIEILEYSLYLLFNKLYWKIV